MGSDRGAQAARVLLLVALLLFGIAAMHTLGHPSGPRAAIPAGPASEPAAVLAPPGHGTPARATAPLFAAGTVTITGHEPDSGAVVTLGPHHGPAPAAGHGTPEPAPAPGEHGMDSAMVCLAVLGACAAVLLVAAGRRLPRGARRRERAGPAMPRAPAPAPAPPSPRTLLAQLSVLRT
ncbi:hypothetical protein [Streptomyces sp. NPDC001985]|uniref:hypothetical protein n=1 Tax=Streptomyces sp. NPDC001985 TaxID=3154406 RepID=UPI00331A51BE